MAALLPAIRAAGGEHRELKNVDEHSNTVRSLAVRRARLAGGGRPEAVAEVAPTTRVIVNDRADVAHAARRRGAPVHGVHLGQADLPTADARALLGPDALVGLTAGTLDLVRAAEQLELSQVNLRYVGGDGRLGGSAPFTKAHKFMLHVNIRFFLGW